MSSTDTPSTIKVKVLRTVHHAEIHIVKGSEAEIPKALAIEWAKGKKPAVEILKGK